MCDVCDVIEGKTRNSRGKMRDNQGNEGCAICVMVHDMQESSRDGGRRQATCVGNIGEW